MKIQMIRYVRYCKSCSGFVQSGFHVPASLIRRFYATDPKKLSSPEEIEKFIDNTAWNIQHLLPQKDVSDLPEIDKIFVHALLRRSGLAYPKTNEEEKTLQNDLKRQVVFVDHIKEVDTTGLEPLSRLTPPSEELTWNDLQDEQGECQLIDREQFKSKLNHGMFYVKDGGRPE
ncbi:uncharacterized protein V1516DRAFT_681057 [Lipomyces oligophaga]|uniref:uncharacterized protein n=1 Tax=Lipomyces oligophaga TaxID=45792 RepID=UPI0034CDAFF4